jgi:hypothetical protein
MLQTMDAEVGRSLLLQSICSRLTVHTSQTHAFLVQQIPATVFNPITIFFNNKPAWGRNSITRRVKSYFVFVT